MNRTWYQNTDKLLYFKPLVDDPYAHADTSCVVCFVLQCDGMSNTLWLVLATLCYMLQNVIAAFL